MLHPKLSYFVCEESLASCNCNLSLEILRQNLFEQKCKEMLAITKWVAFGQIRTQISYLKVPKSLILQCICVEELQKYIPFEVIQ